MDRFNYDQRVTVYEGEQYENDWPPANALHFIAWLNDKLQAVPAAYRPHTVLEIDTESHYGDYNAKIEIHYNRPPTAEEVAERKAEHDRRNQNERAALKARLARLEGE